MRKVFYDGKVACSITQILAGSVLDFEVVDDSKVDYTDTESSALKA